MKKVVVVCGGTSGIGKAAVDLFGERGWITVSLGRGATPTHEKDHSAWPVDLTDDNLTQTVIAAVMTRYGRIDAVIHSVGDIFEPLALDRLDWPRWSKTLEVCLGSAVNIVRHTLAPLRERGGSYVFISSVAALRPYHGIADYCAAKAALDNFVRSLAMDEAKHGIRANSILPAVVDTPLFARSPFTKDEAAKWHALGRIGTPTEIAGMACDLAGEMGSWVTGQAVVMDGGMLLPH